MSNKPMKKSTTFVLHKSSSMDLSTPSQHSTTASIPRKSPSIEYPTSPHAVLGDEILHFGHPQHPLAQVSLPDLFTCMGCKEFGAGSRFTCRQCDFQLHEFCALAPRALKDHPLHCQHQLVFSSKPVKGGGRVRSKCDICGKAGKGYNFQCSVCGFQMHPCCAMLSAEMDFPVHPHTLFLLPSAMTIANGDPDFSCGECKKKRSGRVYRCHLCNYHLHAVCAKNMINGLHTNGFKGREKASMLGKFASLASQVVREFIVGLIEGLGEGVGQVFVQNMIRGGGSRSSCSNRTRSDNSN